jgi:hypothetical protein
VHYYCWPGERFVLLLLCAAMILLGACALGALLVQHSFNCLPWSLALYLTISNSYLRARGLLWRTVIISRRYEWLWCAGAAAVTEGAGCMLYLSSVQPQSRGRLHRCTSAALVSSAL